MQISNMTDHSTGDDTGEDLYNDLPAFQYDDQIAQLQKDNKVYKEETAALIQRVSEEADKNIYLEKENDALKMNISALFKTAKSELQRKDNMINDLRREISNITFRRNKKVMKDQVVNTDIVAVCIPNDTFHDMMKRVCGNENARNSVSSMSSGSKASEYDDEKSHSKERKKVDFKMEKEEVNRTHEKKSRSRERDERLDYNKERKPERGREDEYARRRDSKLDNVSSRDSKFQASSRSRFDKFHESPRGKEKDNKYRRSRSSYRPSDTHESNFKKFESRRRSRNGRFDGWRESPEFGRRESPEIRRRESPEARRKESPDIRRRQSPEIKRKESLDIKRRDSPEIRKRDSAEVKRRDSPEGRRRKSCDRRKSRERPKVDSGIKKEQTGDLRELIKNKTRNLSSEKHNDKKDVKGLNGDVDFKLEKSPPLKENNKNSDIEITCSSDNKKDKDRTGVKNKINVGEKRKNSLNSEKNKKHEFDTKSPLEALYSEMEKDEGVTSSRLNKNAGKVVDKDSRDVPSDDSGAQTKTRDQKKRDKNPRDIPSDKAEAQTKLRDREKTDKDSRDVPSDDYGEDWALSFKNERVNKPKPKTLYSRRMEEKLLVISANEQKIENKISGYSEQVKKDEKVVTNNLTDKKVEEEKAKEKADSSLQALENLKKILNNEILMNEGTKKIPEEEKEPGEISDEDESDGKMKEQSPVEPVLNSLKPAATENVKTAISDTSSEMESILEPPKTPDIRNEQIQAVEKVPERNTLILEFSPFKNNYKLIRISPLKPGGFMWTGSNVELCKEKNKMKPIENLGDTPKKSDIYNKENSVCLEGNSSGQISHLESSLELSKSIVEPVSNKSSEEKELNVTPSEEQDIKPVEETISTPNIRKDGDTKRRSVRSRNCCLKKEEKKELQESVKENVRETRSSQKSDQKGRNSRNRRKSEEKVKEKIEKPKIVRNNKRKRDETVEVKKEPRKRKRSEGKSKEPAKKMKKEASTSGEGPSSLEDTDPEKKQDVTEFEFFKPKDVTPTEKPKQFLTIQEKPEIEDISFSNSWMATISSRMSVTGQVVCLETPNKCIEGFKNLLINDHTISKTGSIFSPLPCGKINDFMTPRRMLRNDLMLTDSEEESPVKGEISQISKVNEVAESVESDESGESNDESSGDDSDSGASDFVDLL